MSERMILKYLRPLALLLSATMLMGGLCACRNHGTTDPTEPGSQSTADQPGAEDPTFLEDDPQENTTYEIPTDETVNPYHLDNDLMVTDIGKYAGIFMEDGSDEVVSNTLMLILRNDNILDLQLARIELRYADFTAEFEVTNLPAGESVVLLEKNRHAYVEEEPYYMGAENVVFFQEEMGLHEDTLKLSGTRGSITVENLSDSTLGEIYVYYKNSAVDLLYGGITYRARVDAGLAPGEATTVMTGHYNPDTCTIINVQIAPASDQ